MRSWPRHLVKFQNGSIFPQCKTNKYSCLQASIAGLFYAEVLCTKIGSSLGPRPKTNPSADRFQYRARYTASDTHAGWGLGTRPDWLLKWQDGCVILEYIRHKLPLFESCKGFLLVYQNTLQICLSSLIKFITHAFVLCFCSVGLVLSTTVILPTSRAITFTWAHPSISNLPDWNCAHMSSRHFSLFQSIAWLLVPISVSNLIILVCFKLTLLSYFAMSLYHHKTLAVVHNPILLPQLLPVN